MGAELADLLFSFVLFEKGYFLRPTVISGLADSSACMQEEIFGPVVCVAPFDAEEEVIRRANQVTIPSTTFNIARYLIHWLIDWFPNARVVAGQIWIVRCRVGTERGSLAENGPPAPSRYRVDQLLAGSFPGYAVRRKERKRNGPRRHGAFPRLVHGRNYYLLQVSISPPLPFPPLLRFEILSMSLSHNYNPTATTWKRERERERERKKMEFKFKLKREREREK